MSISFLGSHRYVLLALLEGFITFMDCCLRTRASNVVRNIMRWIISEASIEWQQRKMYFVQLHSTQWFNIV